MFYGPWSQGPWSLVPGPGPQRKTKMQNKSKNILKIFRSQGPWSLVPGSLVPGPWVPGPWSLVPGVPGPWSQAPGPGPQGDESQVKILTFSIFWMFDLV